MLMVNHLSGFGIGGTVQTQVSGSTGSWSGSMSDNGGIAAAHDNNTSQATAAASRSVNANAVLANIIVDWGAGVTKLISRFRVYAPTDVGIWDTGTGTLTLRGSTDNFSTSDVSLYTASGLSDPGASGEHDINQRAGASIIVTTAYRYHKLELTSSIGKPIIAELVFYEER